MNPEKKTPGPALDAEIERAVFGGGPCDCLDCRYEARFGRAPLHPPPAYSADPGAALGLLEALRGDERVASVRLVAQREPAYAAQIRRADGSEVEAAAETAALALCLAALRALS
jgi:hypothetical protein